MFPMKNNKGFTLVEMLACVVTILLVGLICASGINIAINSYRESVFESESQMLNATMNLYVSDILRHATNVRVDADDPEPEVTGFTNTAYQIYDGNFYIDDHYHLYCSTKQNPTGSLVVGKGNYGKTLQIRSFRLYYDGETQMFRGSYTIGSSVSDKLIREYSFTYRAIAGE